MKQESFAMSMLLDYYGSLLTQKQKTYFDLYYNQDLSLTEIAEQEGISRQGVHDTITRTEAILRSMEEATGCVERANALRTNRAKILEAANALMQHEDPTVRLHAEGILTAVSAIKE
ncbi:MAG: DNA-binding protein [Ruminococcaceae bacterium]|nr:DNA-binding protein [Oscillospiraceae bacterium]